MVFGDMFSLDYAADGIPDLPATGGIFAGTADNNVWADYDLPDRGPDMPMDDAVFPDNATVVSGAVRIRMHACTHTHPLTANHTCSFGRSSITRVNVAGCRSRARMCRAGPTPRRAAARSPSSTP